MATVKELETKRAEAAAAREKEREAQYVQDLEAIIALEGEHGTLYRMKPPEWKRGTASCAAFRSATRSEYKRYISQLGEGPPEKRGAATRKAAETLGESVMVYPPAGAAREAFLEAYPGAILSIYKRATEQAELEREEEGKD